MRWRSAFGGGPFVESRGEGDGEEEWERGEEEEEEEGPGALTEGDDGGFAP